MSGEAMMALKKLTLRVSRGEISVAEFCDKYEDLFNFEVKKTEIPLPELKVYSDLFEKVVYFSPFKDEVERIPIYFGEEEILDAARTACKTLGLSSISFPEGTP